MKSRANPPQQGNTAARRPQAAQKRAKGASPRLAWGRICVVLCEDQPEITLNQKTVLRMAGPPLRVVEGWEVTQEELETWIHIALERSKRFDTPPIA